MGINDAIDYSWPYEWPSSGISCKTPTVNRLLKAIIERDFAEADSLFKQGACLSHVDKTTLGVALYNLASNHDVIEWLVDHGMYPDPRVAHDDKGLCISQCIDPDGYLWGLLARAWYLGSYETMEYLASCGFSLLYARIDGIDFELDELICHYGDIRGMEILREYGYRIKPWDPYSFNYSHLRDMFPESPVIRYVEANPLVRRKGFGLDDRPFDPIAEPELTKPRLFHRSEDQRRNELEQADFEDKCRAQAMYAARWSPLGRAKTRDEWLTDEADMASLIIASAKMHPQ